MVGAGQVGSTVVEALHDEHDVTIIDLDGSRLAATATTLGNIGPGVLFSRHYWRT